MIDYYAILGVPRTATPPEIREAYLKLARTTHPDTVKDPVARKAAEEAFKNVTAAYDTLSRERSRREYTSKLPADDQPRTTAPRVSPPMAQGPALSPRQAGSPASPPSAPVAGTAIPTTGRIEFDALGQGIEAFKKKDYHAAVQLLNAAVSKDEKSHQAHAMLALALARNPNWVRDAMHHMETASKLDPRNPSYLAELALLLNSQGLKLRARRTLESAKAIKPDHPDVARALKEISLENPEAEPPARTTGETARGLFDRLRKR